MSDVVVISSTTPTLANITGAPITSSDSSYGGNGSGISRAGIGYGILVVIVLIMIIITVCRSRFYKTIRSYVGSSDSLTNLHNSSSAPATASLRLEPERSSAITIDMPKITNGHNPHSSSSYNNNNTHKIKMVSFRFTHGHNDDEVLNNNTSSTNSQLDLEKQEICCSICLSEITIKDASPLECGHNFHASCINGWLAKNATCPMCRSPLTTPSSTPLAPVIPSSRLHGST